MQSLEPSVAYATDGILNFFISAVIIIVLTLFVGQEMNRFADALDVFWALVDLAGYPVIPVCTLREVWPDAAADRVEPEQVKVPIQDDLPMPLDIVVSLYLGFSDKAFLATITRVFGEGQVHHAIGKAILPPYKGAAEDIHRRTIVIRSLLLTQRAFEYVLIPRWQLSPGLLKLPAYTKMADVCKVSHWLNEYMSIVGTQVPPDPLADETPAGLRAWVSQPLLQPLTDFLHPAYVLKSYLSAIKPFPNHLLDALWFALQELGETTFLDLSTICLSHKQVINLLNRSAEVEAVSLSGNPEIKSTHLPFIISSAPSLRRLHVMHTGLDNGSTDLHALLTIFPPMFRQLEGIMNPQLLSCSHTTNWPASFAFRHATRTSVEDPYCVSIPFFTPAQVVQALTQILPLAFQEHGYGESIKFWQRDFRLAAQTGANAYAMPSDGFPFYMAAPMFLHATLSCGTLRPGQPWGARPIVSVPMDAAWNLPLTKGWGSWVFHFDWDHRRHRHHLPGKNQWGFILYDIAQDHATVPNAHPGDTPGSSGPVVDKVLDAPQALAPDSEMPATSEAESLDGHADSSTTGSELEPDIYDGTVYDLRGFLRCMAAEGRPLPDVGAVERLENILNTRDPVTGELVCGFMSQDDVPQMEEMYATAEEREAVYTKKYGGLTTDRWATMFPGRFVVRGKREEGFVVMEN